jgi:2-(1,2-epoxy-1,2-dihydrophenyl)acetyl-CoA isomerase
MTLNTLHLNRDGVVATVTMNRPDRMNAMTVTMAREMTETLDELSRDTTLSVVVLTGAGRGFCPGADLFSIASDEADEKPSPDVFGSSLLLHQMPQVTVAAINGPCAGAGLGWAASCDFRYAARRVNFNTSFIDRAVAGDMGLPWSLPRLVGAARARELSFFAEKFSAERAAADGFVTAVFDDNEFEDRVAERVAKLAAASPTALRTLKANYLSAEEMPYEPFVAIESHRHLRLLESAEFAAGVAAGVAGLGATR